MTGRGTSPQSTTLVVPTIGRPSLVRLLLALAEGSTPLTVPVVVVDDRPGEPEPLELPDLGLDLTVVRSGGGGPARARNHGWRRARTEWVSFLDDDVLPTPTWFADLLSDLETCSLPGHHDVTGIQGRVEVPLPSDRRPTDWERGTAGLATAQWITADLSYRRVALAAVGGFDERFPRAFREDADLGLRVTAGGHRIVRGSRLVRHPARPAGLWASVQQQRGNADDFLMRRLHGRDWHQRAAAPRGRRPRNLAVAAAGVLALAGLAARRRRVATTAGLAWAAGTAELAWVRIRPGPRDRAEVVRMLLTSAAIPFAASWHSLRGAWVHRDARPWRGAPDLVLFDRDGTLVHDVPYNGDPALVAPVPGAEQAVARLREHGIRAGVVTNQSGVGTGRISADQVVAVNGRLAELLGPFDTVQVCPHAPEDGCACRKPAPGMVKAACADLHVPADRCVVIGDIGADVEAAAAAGASGILVPTPRTRPAEVRSAARVAASLGAAVDDVLAGRW